MAQIKILVSILYANLNSKFTCQLCGNFLLSSDSDDGNYGLRNNFTDSQIKEISIDQTWRFIIISSGHIQWGTFCEFKTVSGFSK